MTVWIVLGVVAILVVWIISVYNGLVALRQRANQSLRMGHPKPSSPLASRMPVAQSRPAITGSSAHSG